MISDLQADIDQENEPDFSKFSRFAHAIHILILKLGKPHPQSSDKVPLFRLDNWVAANAERQKAECTKTKRPERPQQGAEKTVERNCYKK